jgi:hypothetical protein
VTTEELVQKYQDELKKLVEINEKNDWTPSGDMEFYRQREEVYWAKCALVNEQVRQSRKRAS